ncbi:peroxisomal biogenesis factor 11 [Gongronella butleri]|nr:peroxisomal biogenesis factor 11 [Gongronella butleri]
MLSHQHVDALNRFLHTTYGRERACRLVQYFSRFYVFYLTRHGAPAADIQRWTDLKNHVSNARKFFRLLKPVEFAQAGLKSLGTTDEVLRATGFLKQLGMFLYYSAEVFVLSNSVGFYRPANIKQITDFGQKAWLLGLVASLVAGLYKFQLLGIRAHILAKERTAAIQGEKGIDADLKTREVTLQREKHRATYQFVQDALDCVIPSSALGMLPVDEGFVGLVGIVTSLMCMNTQWSSVNP